MLENHEKPCFTFFAFLPPYIGVSGSLVSGMRKSMKRSIDWYQKFLISWLAARYSTAFVFFIVKIDFLKLNLLPNRAVESFWDGLWLGIRPFFCFIWGGVPLHKNEMDLYRESTPSKNQNIDMQMGTSGGGPPPRLIHPTPEAM